MTEQHIKEAISLRYIELIAAYNGYKTTTTSPDYGTDLGIIEVGSRYENEQLRFFDTGRELKIQLKATTENSIFNEGGFIKYDLEAKTYNDLIHRIKSKNQLLLILFILPPQKEDWVSLTDKELVVKKCAYWFVPEPNALPTENTTTIRIAVNKDNLFIKDTVNQLFEIFT